MKAESLEEYNGLEYQVLFDDPLPPMSAESKTVVPTFNSPAKASWAFFLIPRFTFRVTFRGTLVPMLASTILHLTAILALTFWVIHGRGLGPSGFDITAPTGSEQSEAETIFDLSPVFPLADIKPIEAPTEDANEDLSQNANDATSISISVAPFAKAMTEWMNGTSPTSILSETSRTMIPIPSTALNGQNVQISDALTPTSSPFVGSSLSGRALANRTRVALENGGTVESEKAVELALEWFAAHQYPDGSWSMNLQDPGDVAFNRPPCPCNGRCSGSSTEQLNLKRHSATGLALLCFLGAGYTHREGKYKDNVYRALTFLMDTMRDDREDPSDLRYAGQFASSNSRHLMYEQGIAAFALCEAFQMTKDPLLKSSCQLAVDYISAAQHYGGSWGYHPREVGDLSIVGWQMMALRSAVSSDLKINAASVKRLDNFLLTQQSRDGFGYGYRTQIPTPSMTAIGVLMRLYRGWDIEDPRVLRGLSILLQNGPSKSDLYFDYYATQVVYYTKSTSWPKWNESMRNYLVSTQNADQYSHENGSWFFDEKVIANSNWVGGRLYCTAMATLTLEIYYRFLPSYNDEVNDDFEF